MAHMAQTDPPAADDRTEVRLLAEIAAGVEHAFVELYRRRHNDVYRFAFAMAKSRSFAQDVTQEVFLERARKCQSVRQRQRLGARMAVRLRSLRDARSAAPRTPLDRRACRTKAAAVDGDERLLADQRVERLHAAIARLPVEYREALVLCELQELSYAETAAVLGLSRSAPCARACIAAARCSSRCSTKANARRPIAEPRVATPLQAGEVCS